MTPDENRRRAMIERLDQLHRYEMIEVDVRITLLAFCLACARLRIIDAIKART